MQLILRKDAFLSKVELHISSRIKIKHRECGVDHVRTVHGMIAQNSLDYCLLVHPHATSIARCSIHSKNVPVFIYLSRSQSSCEPVLRFKLLVAVWSTTRARDGLGRVERPAQNVEPRTSSLFINRLSLSEVGVCKLWILVGLEARTECKSTGEYVNVIISFASSIDGEEKQARPQAERINEGKLPRPMLRGGRCYLLHQPPYRLRWSTSLLLIV